CVRGPASVEHAREHHDPFPPAPAPDRRVLARPDRPDHAAGAAHRPATGPHPGPPTHLRHTRLKAYHPPCAISNAPSSYAASTSPPAISPRPSRPSHRKSSPAPPPPRSSA